MEDSKSSKKSIIVIICVFILIGALMAYNVWQYFAFNSKLTSLYTFLSSYTGTDVVSLAEKGLPFNEHPLYDDSKVVAAYKSGNSKGLSEKDAFVLTKASSVIDEVITDGMSDYDKELAIYDWIFNHTHYNNSNFAAVTTSDAGVSASNADNSAADTDSSAANTSGSAAAVSDGDTTSAANGESDGTNPAAENDEIAKEDPYGESYDYEPYGVLKFNQYICVGNATTMKLFMDMLDIPCQIIHSTEEGEHAWDLIQIGGDWYHLDLTFDDGSNSPSYSNFNVTDNVKLDAGYPWDVTKFPAATATKYNYAIKNAVELDDLYDVPEAAYNAINEGRPSVSVTFKKPETVDTSAIDDVLSSISSLYYPDFYFYSSEIGLSDDKTVYMLFLNTDYSEYDSEPSTITIDYEKLDSAISSAFGEALG